MATGPHYEFVGSHEQAHNAAMASLREAADAASVPWEDVRRALDDEAERIAGRRDNIISLETICRIHNRIFKRGDPWPSPDEVRDEWHLTRELPSSDHPGPWVATTVAILWALALEIDERGATRTGENVCRACGGWGEVAVTESSRPSLRLAQDISRTLVPDMRDETRIDEPIYIIPCPCNGPTRPETVSLHRLVSDLAAMKSPRLASLTPLWHVQHDQREQAGDTSWQHKWWRAFMEWTLAGREPDAEALAPLLRRLTDELRERPQPTRRYASQQEMEDDGLLPTDTGGLGGGFDPNAWLEAAARNGADAISDMIAAVGEQLSPAFRRLSDEMRRVARRVRPEAAIMYAVLGVPGVDDARVTINDRDVGLTLAEGYVPAHSTIIIYSGWAHADDVRAAASHAIPMGVSPVAWHTNDTLDTFIRVAEAIERLPR